MGNRQSMVVLKKGDWVKVGIDGCEGLGYITLIDFHPKSHLVQLADGSMPFAVLRDESLLDPLPEGLNPLLNSTQGETK